MKTGIIYSLQCPEKKKFVYVGQTSMPLNGKLKLIKTRVDNKGYLSEYLLNLRQKGLLDSLVIAPLERQIPIHRLTAREEYWIKFCIGEGHPIMNKNVKPFPPNRNVNTAHTMARYFIIDNLLRTSQPTLENLIDAVDGIVEGDVSKRTIQLDLENMRKSEALQFFAPIKYNKLTKTYEYEVGDYSILNVVVNRFYKPQTLKAA